MAWLPGEELTKKIWDSFDKLGTGLLSPFQIRRVGKAKADIRRLEMLSEATALQEIEDIKAGRARLGPKGELIHIAFVQERPNLLLEDRSQASPDNSKVAVAALSDDSNAYALSEAQLIVQQAKAAQDGTALNRFINLRNTVRFVEEELEENRQDHSTPNSEDVQQDWLYEWREGAERTSSEEMRRLWGRLLIEESKAPGSFSLRTMNFLRALDPHDARLIAKITPLVVGGKRIFNIESYIQSLGIDKEDLATLEELGLISGATGLGLLFDVKVDASNPVLFPLHNGKGIRAKSAEPKTINSPVILVSRLGAEIVRLGSFETPSLYIIEIAEVLKGIGLEVTLVDYADAGNGTCVVANAVEL